MYIGPCILVPEFFSWESWLLFYSLPAFLYLFLYCDIKDNGKMVLGLSFSTFENLYLFINFE